MRDVFPTAASPTKQTFALRTPVRSTRRGQEISGIKAPLLLSWVRRRTAASRVSRARSSTDLRPRVAQDPSGPSAGRSLGLDGHLTIHEDPFDSFRKFMGIVLK